MSNWTHVAAVVRIDGIELLGNRPDPYKIFGKECLWDDICEVWEDADNYPEDYLPMGSEGSLQMSIWENPDKESLASTTVTIFGDLRDHDDPQEIVDWFKEKLKRVCVRQATITVKNERNGTVNWTYE